MDDEYFRLAKEGLRKGTNSWKTSWQNFMKSGMAELNSSDVPLHKHIFDVDPVLLQAKHLRLHFSFPSTVIRENSSSFFEYGVGHLECYLVRFVFADLYLLKCYAIIKY